MLRTLSWFEKYKTNIDDVGGKRSIVGTYSSGVKIALKAAKPPMETTNILFRTVISQKFESLFKFFTRINTQICICHLTADTRHLSCV